MRRALFTVGCLALMVAGEAAPPDKSGVKPSAISLPSGPGSIEGLGESFEPQLNTGMSSYGVKIAVAPGRAGLVPNVRLSYHSGQGNGLAGIGWGMELPVIKRQTDKGFPNYNSLDTFLFSGEELVPINDGNGFWRCENESGFQRFRQVDTDGDKFLDAWEMTERNGTRHYFGQYRGEGGRWSAVLHAERLALGATRFDATYSWMLNTTIDVHGNRIEYEYVLGTGVLYPSRITYAHTGGVSQEVLFSYGKRADAFDDFRPTLCSRLDQRLKTVDVRSAGSRVRMYALDYADELSAADRKEMGMGVPDLSLLCRVVQYGRDGKTANYLPPLMFGYSQGGLGSVRVGSLAESGGGAPGLDLAEQNGETQLADVNGDGLPDLFATLSDGVVLVQRVCLNRGEEIVGGDAYTFFEPPLTVANPNRFSLSQPDTTLLDMNGDGLVDVVQVVDEGVNRRFDIYPNRSRPDEVADSDPDKLGFEPSQPVQRLIDGATLYIGFNDPGTRQIDLNFDKISDFLTISPGLSHPVIQGSYQDRDGVWHHEDRWGDFAPVDMRNLSFSKDNRSNPEVQLVDMNGDRLQDIVSLVSDGGISGQLRVMYWPMRGQGRWAESRIMEAAPGDDLQVGDMNLADVFLEDVTGDGLADLLILDGSGSGTRLTVRANVAGQRWAYPVVYGDLPRYEPRALNQPTIFRFADVNGNGSRDLVFRNDGLSGGWQYVDLLFTGKPNLLTRIDNGLGKNTFITYGTSTQEMQRAAAAGAPWVTRASFPLDVVKRIRTSCGLDLNGDGREDQQVSDFQYRDAFYDGMEREFRGFGFAQRTDYGDDFIYNNGLILRTGNSSPSAPTLVTRYRFLTGSADGRDNDEGGDGSVDEFTERGGREEEPLKGRLVVEEKLDASVAYGTLGTNFDVNCRAAAVASNPALRSRITPDAVVFSRVRQEWKIRRLYRPAEALPIMRDQDRDGFLDAPELRVASPPGRQGSVRPGNGRSVSFAFASTVETDVLEANGILAAQSGLPVRGGYLTRKTFDHDDYGNQTLAWDEGIVGGGFDDERVVRTTYALGLNALSLWVIDKPDTVLVTDENGAFVAKKIHFYDGAPYGGLQGQIEKRALLHRTREFKTEGSFIEATRHAYDEFGNPIGLRDPNGNQRVIGYDSTFHIYPTSETIVVGRGSPDLSVSASYDTGFGVVTGSTDFNGNATSYRYDTFGRLVGVVRPGDSVGSPTQAFAYQPADPSRGRIYAYDAAGNLSLGVGARVASRVESRQREKAGGGEFITATFTDGCGKKLGSVAEGASDGTWIVRDAVSYNLRGSAQSQWLPFQISAAGVPQFGDVWTAAGRPPLGDGINPAVVSSDVFQDSVGRVVATVDAPETWGGVRKSSRVQYLPFEERHFDQEDADPGSVHASTPLVRYTDGLGRLIAVEEVVRITDTGEPGSPASWRTAYAYDLNDQLLRIQDSQNNVKTMAYDGLKRMVAMNDPDRGPLTVLYDDASNIRETVDAKGQRITYTYDGANRIKTEDYGDTAGISPDVSFTYDVAGPFAAGNGATGSGTNLRGQIASVRDLSGEIHFSYDARGRKISEIKRIPDRLTGQLVGYRTAFTYDSADRLETLTYPDGDKLNHAYNARSLLSDLSGNLTGSLLGSISYRPSGQIASLRYGNGITTTYTYDPRMRLRTLNTQSPSAQLVGFSYTFDGASNITRIDDVRELGAQPQPDARFNSQTFAYDNLYRLTRVDYPGRQGGAGKHVDYRYDRIGNMLQQTSDIVQEEEGRSVVHFGAMESGGSAGRFGRSGREPGAPPGPHAITRAGASRSYDYDANGNMTTIDGLRCTWDFKDRLVAAENDQMRAVYTYDYQDRRITKTVFPKIGNPGQFEPTTTQYINQFFEIRDYDAPVKYVWNGATRVARVTASLDSNPLTQVLRLRTGWNLVALRVGGTFPALDPAQNPALGASCYWNPTGAGNGLSKVDGSVPIPAGTSAWIYAKQDTSLSLTGTPASGALPALTGRSQFLANSLPEPLDLAALLPANALLLRFDPLLQRWRTRYPAAWASASSSMPPTLPPGESAWTRDGTPGDIRVSAAALRVRYYHPDHLGSSSVITDQSGALVEETAYYPFGHPRNAYKPGPPLAEPYGFTQKERDKESGLHYFEARYLVSYLGRFASVDSIDSPISQQFESAPPALHLYAYSSSRPTVLTDPSGRKTWWESEDKSKKLDVDGAGSAGAFIEAGNFESASLVSLGARGTVDIFNREKSSICGNVDIFTIPAWNFKAASRLSCYNADGTKESSWSFLEKAKTIVKTPEKDHFCQEDPTGRVKACVSGNVNIEFKPWKTVTDKEGKWSCMSVGAVGTGQVDITVKPHAFLYLKGGFFVETNAVLSYCSKYQ